MAELISVGRELLSGRVADANATTLARFLSQRGAIVRRIVIVDDDEAAIAQAAREALMRSPNLLIVTGGLGPGIDDHTLPALAEALGLPLAPHAGAKAIVESAYQRLRAQRVLHKGGLTAARERLCRLPVGSQPVANTAGIAPGVVHRVPGATTVLATPGAPEELQAVLTAAGPLLRALAPGRSVARREIESPTADESALLPLLKQLALEHPSVWVSTRISAGPPRAVLIDLEAVAANYKLAVAAADAALKRLLALAAGSP